MDRGEEAAALWAENGACSWAPRRALSFHYSRENGGKAWGGYSEGRSTFQGHVYKLDLQTPRSTP